MDAIKRSPEAAITFGLINAIGRTHPTLERRFVDFFAGKAIGVTTNVIGPGRDRFVAGRLLEGILAWVPGSGRQTLGACIVTYGGRIRVGFKADAGVVPDPEHLVAAFDQEVDDLVRMAGA
jgi:diacylglycerol O-acyltransferase